MPHARVNGIDLHYDLTDYTDPWRESETILLHHGFARNLEFWREWVPLLARHYRVLRIDARGCGRSTIPPPGYVYTFDQCVADAIGLMDALGIKKVHWAAEASGGIIGLLLALHHPDRVMSLSLINTPFQLPQATNDLFVPEEVTKLGMGHWARKTLHNRLDVNLISKEWVDWSTAEFDKNPPHASIAQHEMIADANLYARLHEIQAPVLVMAGAKSKIAPAEQLRKMKEAMPNVQMVLLEEYGQGIAFMIPERCVAEVRRFIEQRDRKS